FMTLAPGASPVYGWIEWLLSWFNAAIICGSEQERKHAIQQLHIRENILREIPNGVQLDYPSDRARARSELGYGEKDFGVGFVGRLVPQKNPSRLIQVFAAAAKQNPNLRLAIIGDGPLQPDVEKALTVQGLTARVRIVATWYARDFMPGFDCLLC